MQLNHDADLRFCHMVVVPEDGARTSCQVRRRADSAYSNKPTVYVTLLLSESEVEMTPRNLY